MMHEANRFAGLGLRAKALAATAVLLVVATACSSNAGDADGADAAAGETFDLTWTTYLSPENPSSRATEDWMAKVEEHTDGRVSFEQFYAGSLCSATEGLPCARDGRADLAFTSVNFHPAEFPLSNAVAVPFVSTDAQAQLETFSQLYREHEGFRAEHDAQGVHVLFFTSIAPSVMGANEPVASIDDLSGKQVRAIAFMVDALDIIGANPVAIDSPEIYESMQRGLIDVWFAYPMDAAVLDTSLEEVTDYITYPGLGTYVSVHTVMNDSVWDSLPDDIQQVMTEASAEIEDAFIDDYQVPAEEEACDTILSSGTTFTVWSEDEQQRWEDAIGDTIVESWIAESERLGAPDPAGFLEEYQSLLADFEADSDYVPAANECAERYERE